MALLIGFTFLASGVTGEDISDEIVGYIDKSGQFVIQPKFQDGQSFSEGLAAVRSEEKWGYIDRDARFIIRPQYEKAEKFSEGFAPVSLNSKWGFVNREGVLAIPCKF